MSGNDLSPNIFTSNGQKFQLDVQLRSVAGGGVPLDPARLSLFEYESELNGLVHRGAIEYVDAVGALDRYMYQSDVVCVVQFIRREQRFDEGLVVEQPSASDRLLHVFLVDNMRITGRSGNEISYRIELVSQNVTACLKNLAYSNYAAGPETGVDVIRNCIVAQGEAVDQDAFDAVRSGSMMSYATQVNDNLFTAVRHVLNKMYYYPRRDESFKYVFFDEFAGRYTMFDMNRPEQTATGVRSVVLSLMKYGDLESLTSEDPIGMGTVTRFSQTDAVGAFSDKVFYGYDYSQNAFNKMNFSNFMLNAVYSKGADSTLVPRCFPVDSDIRQHGAYWDNDFNLYGGMTDCLFKNNALIISVPGVIQCRPGCVVNVSVDRVQDVTGLTTHKELDDQINRYTEFGGVWYTRRVHTYVRPAQKQYKQLLTLVRNTVGRG